MTNLIGKRYKCEKCGTEMLCISGGSGTFACCGQEMVEVELESLPSAD